MKSNIELPVLEFRTQKLWRNWLAKNFNLDSGIWLRLYKKDSGIKSLNYSQALEEALCFGWIDGQANKYDDISYIQKFTPRRKRSMWSKRNIEKVEQLIKEGKMQAPGIKQIELAKADGRWDNAYDSPSNMEIPGDFIKLLAEKPKALAFFESLNKTNTYAIAWRLQTAKKPETRLKRMNMIIDMLERGEKFH